MNSIRTPRKGTNANSRRIAEAVDNEEWQEFRLSLKGLSTRDKLVKLRHYWIDSPHSDENGWQDCDICIRVDNYIKALCRGGQLFPGESIFTMPHTDWNPAIKS